MHCGLATVTYTITATGCSTTYAITVLASPGAILGTTTVCLGGTSVLSDAVGGGTWTSVSGGIATIGSTSSTTALLTGVGAGTSTISYVLGDGCYTTTTATVNPGAGTITGPDSVCTTSTITLTDATGGGTWSASGGATVVSGTGVVTGVTAGTATITYTITLTGCYTTYVVTVNATPAAITGSHTVCESGGTTVLSDISAGGTWSASNTTATIDATGTVTGGVAGVDTITYTLATGGCSVTFNETVNPLPAAITGTDSVCVNATVSLSDATGSGTWSTTGGTGSVTVGGTGIVTGVSAGTATITYTLGTSCYVTYDMTVNAIPAAITGTAAVCAHEGTTTLTDATGGGIWSSSNTGIATVDATGVVSGVTAGTDTIIYTLPVTGCFIILPIVVNPLPTAILGTDSVCVASTVTLSDMTGAGTWSTASATASVVGGTGVVTGASFGGATISYSLGTGCYVTFDMTVNPLPAAMTATSLAICSGLTADFTDITTGGSWSSSATGTAAIGAVSGIATGGTAGTATISFILPTGCYVTSVLTVNPLPTAILGTDSVCVGSSVTLSDLTGGGTWSESSIGTLASISAGSGTLTGLAQGTDTVTYTLGTGCIATMTMTVNPLPAAITGASTICSGLTITLSDATPGGTWSSSASGTAAVSATGVVTGGTAGTATISYTLPTGCYSTFLVTVNGLPSGITGPGAVCVGSTITLIESTGGGTWSESSAGAVASIGAGTGIVTGVFAGTDTVTYTITATGCLITDIITVNPLPAAISGPTAVCVGSSITLSDITGGGHWTSSNNLQATAGLLTGVVTGVSASTPTISYTLTATGCYATYPITVNPLPTAILGPVDVCEAGGTITLSDMTGGGNWISMAPGVATVGSSSGVVTGVIAGTAVISYILTATSCATSTTINVHPLPGAIGGPSVVCTNSTITLTDASGGGTWSESSAGVIATIGAGSGNLFGVSAGTTTVTYTITATGCYITTPITVNPQPPAVITPIGDTMLCPGGFVDLTANIGAGLTYQWYDGGAAIGGATVSSYLTGAAGTYMVQITNIFGCIQNSLVMTVSMNPATAVITTGAATTFCSGTSVTLNANIGAGLTYQWQLGGVSISGATASTYAATTGGDYTAIVTNSSGCYAVSNTITLTMKAAPRDSVYASGSMTFCMGDSVRLTGDSGYVYQWKVGGANIAGATNRTYTATTSGNYTLLETNTSGCNTTSVTQIVTANALPASTISAGSATTFCAGGSVILSTPAVAGESYQWYKNGILITGATAFAYTASTGGVYTVRVTNGITGCVSTTASPDTVVVINTPTIIPLSSTSFCWGSGALLAVDVVGATGISYQWQRNGTNIPGATNSTYNAGLGGTYTCNITLLSGCSSMSTSTLLTEYPLPNPIITWDGVRLHAGAGYTSYQWYENTILLTGKTDSTLIPLGDGHYTVGVTDTNGCQSVSDVYVLTGYTATGAGVGNVNSINAIRIYPNPAQGVVRIASPIRVRAVVSSVDGRKLLEVADAQSVDISSLADGVYMISLYDADGNRVKTEKLVKSSW